MKAGIKRRGLGLGMFCSKVLPYLVKWNRCIAKQLTSSDSALQPFYLAGDLCNPVNSHLPCIHQPPHAGVIPQHRLNQEESSQRGRFTNFILFYCWYYRINASQMLMARLNKAMTPAAGEDKHPPPSRAPRPRRRWAGCGTAPPAAPLRAALPTKVVPTCGGRRGQADLSGRAGVTAVCCTALQDSRWAHAWEALWPNN